MAVPGLMYRKFKDGPGSKEALRDERSRCERTGKPADGAPTGHCEKI